MNYRSMQSALLCFFANSLTLISILSPLTAAYALDPDPTWERGGQDTVIDSNTNSPATVETPTFQCKFWGGEWAASCGGKCPAGQMCRTRGVGESKECRCVEETCGRLDSGQCGGRCAKGFLCKLGQSSSGAGQVCGCFAPTGPNEGCEMDSSDNCKGTCAAGKCVKVGGACTCADGCETTITKDGQSVCSLPADSSYYPCLKVNEVCKLDGGDCKCKTPT